MAFEKIYYSVRECTKITGCSEFYLRQRIAKNDIAYISSGRKVLINLPRLIEQLDAESTSVRGEY